MHLQVKVGPRWHVTLNVGKETLPDEYHVVDVHVVDMVIDETGGEADDEDGKAQRCNPSEDTKHVHCEHVRECEVVVLGAGVQVNKMVGHRLDEDE